MPPYCVQATNLPDCPMVRAYLECAEWCGLDDCEDSSFFEEHGNTEREAFELSVSPRWTDEALRAARLDCACFLEAAAIEGIEIDDDALSQAGHDFWLTRNGHGAGFWSGDWPEPAGKILTELSKPYGEEYVSFDPETETLSLD